MDQNNVDNLLKKYVREGAVTIKEYYRHSDLLRLIQSAIDAGDVVIYQPTHLALRHFYSTDGFVAALSEVGKQIVEGETRIPPGEYEGRHLVVFGPTSKKNVTQA